ncbi:MAG: hypothetical protein N3D11_18025 [Candidatus Sumerlaeia bacterium]|nr:hypothetical protein [Candidatus Sumerlaeia bacterium]
MTVEACWQRLLEKTEGLKGRVEKKERGGDLEGLIEEGLNEMDVEIYKVWLEARERAVSAEGAAFSPSGMSSVSGVDESGASQAAGGVDTTGGIAIGAKRV